MSELAGKLDNWSDRLSPMLVKEVRQMVRGKEFNYSFGLALVAGLIVAFFGLASAVDATSGAGPQIFGALIACLALEGLVVVPLGAFNALRNERQDNTFDLITQTALTPRRIVIGKLTTQCVKLVILFAGLAPFVAMSFLLGGVSFLTILLSLAVLFIWSLWAASACLFISSASASRAVSGVLFTVMTVGFFAMIGRFAFIWRPLLGFGGGPVFGGPGSSALWWAFGASTVFCFISMVNFVLLAENRLSLPVEDRSTSLRVGFLIQYLFLIGCCVGPLIGGAAGYTAADAMTSLGLFGGIQLAVVAIFSTTEDMTLSRRVIRNIKPSLSRPWVALFRPGGGRGTAWVLLQMLLLLGTGFMISPAGSRDFQWLIAVCCYIAFFSGVPAGVGHVMFKSYATAARLRVATLVAMPVVMLSADILQYFFKTDVLRADGYSMFHILNPFRTLDNWTNVAGFGWDWATYAMGAMGLVSYYALMRIGQQETRNASILHTTR